MERAIMSMQGKNRRYAFTLIEVLIVVIIMAVLAATIVPQFSSSTTDAKKSALEYNLRAIRSQLETYKAQHLDEYPKLATLVDQLTKATDRYGDPDAADTPYGPYLIGDLPANPFNGSSQIVAGDGSAVVAGGAGWQYDEATGGFYANNPEAYP